VGELIQLKPYLDLRSAARRSARREPAAPQPEARSGACESCEKRSARAEVFRSDALAAGLGGRLQCERCLAAELRRGRCGPDARTTQRLLAQRLRGALRTLRLEVDWDVHLGRAVALDGERLP
jgi:hypothetical protein